EPLIKSPPAPPNARPSAAAAVGPNYNDRGTSPPPARVTDPAREGVVVGLSIWWKKLSPDGRNANQVTSQALTDLGGSATFYDCLVEVEPMH
ncbi:molybdopterin dinucleotide binding domain-containing protein, partial [Caballeronia sp. AAUFL_F1_KS47]|uniref:molybdopterin dinucleotide binding domain-containing protein n=1 Tax=Caballeronia sp. AAUFL_F1_KS47 TaxID=2921771 RepID=UPI0032EE54B4